MRAVNLLPRDEQRARLDDKRLPLFVGAGGIAAITILFVLLGLSASSSADDKRAKLIGVQIAIAKLPQGTGTGPATGLISQERTDRVTALAAALTTQVSFDRLMRQISRVLPEDVWLTKLSAATPSGLTGTPATPATSATTTSTTPTTTAAAPVATVTNTVTIEGTTRTQEGVARFLSRLAVVPTLGNVRLTSTNLVDLASTQALPVDQTAAIAPKKGKKVVTFVITASRRTGGVS
jgi:Tfp pilus assembly protein PilN